MALTLRQGQVWKKGDQFIRIVHLERLEVQYKTFADLASSKGEHHHTSKKEFCRLLKYAVLISFTRSTSPPKTGGEKITSPAT